MRRVVVTGMGGITPIGNTLEDIETNLRHGNSGITFCEEFADKGFAAKNKGAVKHFVMPDVGKETLRQLGIGNALRFAHASAQSAIDDAGLDDDLLFKAGVVFGQGGGSTIDTYDVAKRTIEKGRPSTSPRTVNSVTPTMASGCSAEIATHFRMGAFNYCVSAACATGNFAIGSAARHILMGDAPIVVAGSCDSTDWVMSAAFDVLTAMSRNKFGFDVPEQVSRPFDRDRSGFVMGEGAGTLVLEDLDHALARGAKIYCEISSFGFSSDGKGEPTDPDRDGAMRSMYGALKRFDGTPINPRSIGYVKAHGTSTEKGDDNELDAIAGTFSGTGHMPRIGSTKSLTGHALGGAGAIESIFSILMLTKSFLAPSINIDTPSDKALELGLENALLTTGVSNTDIEAVLANSFGFGGTNASLVFTRYEG